MMFYFIQEGDLMMTGVSFIEVDDQELGRMHLKDAWVRLHKLFLWGYANYIDMEGEPLGKNLSRF